ncbi:hypothetical protein NMY22_g10029 [Coprinellus aureogranulatus]|nr:hypothetical protein NMY22_g10029 [Coprinellus aureogranulatus]
MPRQRLACCLALVASLLCFQAESADARIDASSHVVDLGYAKYQGVINSRTGNTQFLGMRYARAPTGDLRWREPKPPLHTPGIQAADTLLPNCPRGAMGVQLSNPFKPTGNPSVAQRSFAQEKQEVAYSEDCLFLNVFVPGTLDTTSVARQGFPVVVWIHGGGYIGGGIGNDGNDLITAAHGGVVVVQMQYRLGVFGFLAGAEVKKHGVFNAGLYQQFALRWVQEHVGLWLRRQDRSDTQKVCRQIAKFGGDPRKVTIWANLLALDPSAITSSTFLPSQYPFDGPIPEAIYNHTIARAGCYDSENSLQCLRNLSSEDLMAVNVDVCASGFYGTFVFAPVVDGTFIKRSPSASIKYGKLNTNPLLAVTNTYEGIGFVPSSWTSTVGEYVSQLFPLLPKDYAMEAATLYEGLGTVTEQIGLIMGEAIFTCPTYTLLRGVSQRAYKGHFAVPPARHAGDVAYYYPSNGAPAWSHLDFDRAFSESFPNFVLTGDPNIKVESNILPPWRKWTSLRGSRVEMVFNRTEDFMPDIRESETDEALLRRWVISSFWDKVSAWTGQ